MRAGCYARDVKERVNITVDADLLARIDEAARAEHTTRSALIRRVMREFVEQRDGVPHGASGAQAVREDVGAWGVAATHGDAPEGRGGAPDLDVLLALLRAFFAARDDVAAAWVFGSLARGDAWSRSDVDIAVLPARDDLGADEEWALRSDIASRLEVLLGRRVDVVPVRGGSALLRCRAVCEGVAVCGDGVLCALERMKAVAEYLDFNPVVREAERFWRERVERYDTVR
ncbi:MAG: hypothetical protein Kow0056_05190 [Coriobacteriia bacterium]